jgi:hypothetical protein
MRSRCAALFLVQVGTLCVLGASPSRAAELSCASMVVEVDATVRAQWPDLSEDIRDAFAAVDDLDACARVTVFTRGASIVVRVALPDGRSASRSVSRRQDVVPTLEALLLVPQRPKPLGARPPEGPAPAATANAKNDDPGASARLTTSGGDVPETAPASEQGRLQVELSVAVGARIGDGQAGGGFGALSFLEVAGWLAGFEGRLDGYQGFAAGNATGAVELAVLGGRRLRRGTLALDLIVGPELALQWATKSVMQVGSTAPAVTTSPFRMDPRLLLGAHLSFRALSTLRTFIGIEGEFGRALSAAESASDLPPLPRWTVGLVLGTTVGTK